MGRAEYDRNWMLQSAVERQLEIIGEAASRLSDDFGSSAGLPIRQAKGLRNVISHEYFRVNHDRVWNVVINRVPELLSALTPHPPEGSEA